MTEKKKPPKTNAQQWKDFLRNPAWKEFEAMAFERINELSRPLVTDKPGLDDLLARGIKDHLLAEMEYMFIHLPVDLLRRKEKDFEKDPGGGFQRTE